MKTFNAEQFMNKGGWFIGNFEPSVLKTDQFEVCYKIHPAGEEWSKHHHKISDEINFLMKGKMTVNDVIIESNTVFVIEKNESVKPIFLEDCELIVVKVPSSLNDKYDDE